MSIKSLGAEDEEKRGESGFVSKELLEKLKAIRNSPYSSKTAVEHLKELGFVANIDSTNVWSWLDNFIEKAEKQNREGEVDDALEGKQYDYDELVKKDDMVVEKLSEMSTEEYEHYQKNKNEFALEAMKRVKMHNHPLNTETRAYVHCSDIEADIMVAKDSFKHGLARVNKEYYQVCLNFFEIIENSIAINELNARENTNGGIVLLGMCETDDYYIYVRTVVNRKTYNAEEYDIVKAIRKSQQKKEDADHKAPGLHLNDGSQTSSTISIANLLDNVKNIALINEVFSNDVAKKLGVRKSKGDLSNDLRYSKSKGNIDFEEVDGGVKVSIPNPIIENADRKRAAEQEQKESFRNLVENDPDEIKYRAAEKERKESEESLLNEGGKVRETTTEFDEPEMSNEERRLMASAERVASGKDFFPRHAEMRPSNDESWDYWLGEVDRRVGSVKRLKNGKVKVGMAQTANEVKLTKFINNKIMDKAYSNENVKSVIDKILSNSDIWGADESGAYIAKLKGADLITVKKRLWATLNTAPEGERIGPALDIADFIVTHGMIEETVEITEDVINAQYIIDTLEPYKRKIDISHIKGDIEAVFDTDRSPFGLWAQKKSDTSRPFTADEVGQALEDAGIMLGGERGKLINEADIFIAMHKRYTEAQAIIKAATPTKNDIIGAYDAKEVHEIKQKIAREILRSYDEYGKETSFARLEKKFRGEIASLKRRVSEVYELNRAKNETLYLAGKFQDKKKGKFHNATQAQNEALNGIISVLSKLKYRSDINKSSSRALLDELAKWYTEENPLLQGGAVDKKTSESKGFYSPYIKELIDYFRIDNEDGGQSRTPVPTIEIKKDSELAKRIESADYSKYDVIREYLIEKFYGQEFNLSDGKKAIMDKRDAQHLAHNATEERTAQLAEIKKIIEKANYSHSAVDVEHPKFSQFHYYDFSVKYGEEKFDLWLNVGVAKNDGKNHIYAITNKNEEAPTNYGVARPVGNALQNASSDNSITENGEKVNNNAKNNAELSLDELHAINKILAHMNFVVENFGKIWRHGKWIDAKDVGTKQLNIFNSAVQNQTVITRLIGNKFTVIILFYSTGQKSCVFSF